MKTTNKIDYLLEKLQPNTVDARTPEMDLECHIQNGLLCLNELLDVMDQWAEIKINEYISQHKTEKI